MEQFRKIETGADLEAINEDNNTPLHLAADFGCFDIVKYLIEKGVKESFRIVNKEKKHHCI
jgi:ankyrin repeat protein